MNHTITELHQLQALPLSVKVRKTKQRIREWYEYYQGNVYISFSGGKDSTVLLTLAREMYTDIPAVFVDTGLEYPEIREFVKTFDNVEWLRPSKNFKQVISDYGYPFISKEVSNCVDGARKYVRALTDRQTDRQTVPNACYMADILGIDRRVNKENPIYKELQKGIIPSEGGEYRLKRLEGTLQDAKGNKSQFNQERYKFFLDAPFEISDKCCDVMKKKPAKEYERRTGNKPIIATMATESLMRTQKWLHDGCNAFECKRPISKPLSFWTEQDILTYILENDIEIASVYGNIVRDYEGEGMIEGQMSISDYGLFELERPLLKTTGCRRTGCMFCGYGCHLEKAGEGRFEKMKVTHPRQYEYIVKSISEGGLGYKEVIEWINEHGDLNIRI